MIKKELKEEELKEAYNNYADSHWIEPEEPNSKLLSLTLYGLRPMEHSFETFSNKCKNNESFYKKYTGKYKNLDNKK